MNTNILKRTTTLAVALTALLVLAGCADPISEKAIDIVASVCKKQGMAIYVFNGSTSYAKCVHTR